LHHDSAPSHTSFLKREFWPKITWLLPHPPYFSVFPTHDKVERLPFRHSWGDRGRIVGGAEHFHRSIFPDCI
jgi:hypothetical protein